MDANGSRARLVEHDSKLPEKADVVVIGGGILGVCTAYFLAKKGVSVALFEKGVIAGEASGRSVGQVASAGLGLPKMPLVRESKRLWAELTKECESDTGYRTNGLVIPARTSDELAIWESWLSITADFETEARLLNGRETAVRVPASHNWEGAYFNPTDGCAEPPLAAPAVAETARGMGVTIHQECAVRGLDVAAGRVAGVVTEKGVIKTDTAVLAGGAWSRIFARSLGVDLPILSLHASCQSITGVENGPDGTGDLPGVTWRREISGDYTIAVIGGVVPIVPASFRLGYKFLPVLRQQGAHWELKYRLGSEFLRQWRIPPKWKMGSASPFEGLRVFAPDPESKLTIQARQRISRLLPAFQTMKVKEEWAGAIEVTPDNMPIIGPVSSIQGFHLLCGFSYGLTMAPGAGKLLADIVTGNKTELDSAPYRYERFHNGSLPELVA